jgi:hypothetical protein
MPRIKLKPNSPDYADEKQKSADVQLCEFPGCHSAGEHKAPKHRGLNEYYYFCMEHVRDYNKAWDFFDGMNAREVEEHMLKSLYGDRPTWRYDTGGLGPEEFLYEQAWQEYNFTEEKPASGFSEGDGFGARTTWHHDTPEYKAMATLGLEPPLDLTILKKRYKELAKKYHPDHNRECDKSEDLLKEVNIAYTVLKAAFEKFEKIESD